MTSDGHGRTAGERSRRRHSGRAMRVLGWLSVIMCAVLVVGSLSAYAAFRELAGNITKHEVSLGADRPEDSNEAVNILLIGSDTRAADGTQQYGAVEGARSDTVILLHMPPGHNKAMLVSFPRDSVVDIPSCEQSDGTMSQPMRDRLNTAFTVGGPACTWKTIESTTGIHIDHFVMVNFAGFKQTVNALGGVQICMQRPVNDPKSGLNIPAGPTRIQGEQALAFVRLRNIGNHSDLERIQRQQQFLAGMVKKATSRGLLLQPSKMFNFLSAATNSLTMDSGFSLQQLQQLAMSARGIKPGDVDFVTVPVEPSGDEATVLWKQPEADQLFTAIKSKEVWPGESSASGAGNTGDQGDSSNSADGSASGPPDAQPTVPPPGVQVRVLNGTDISGLAGRTAEKLRSAGYDVVEVGNADSQAYGQTLVRYDPELETSAKIVASATGAGGIETDETLGRSVSLVLGEDAQGLRVQHGPEAGSASSPGSGTTSGGGQDSSPIPEEMESLNASQNPCRTDVTG